jgi:hypothetical protein
MAMNDMTANTGATLPGLFEQAAAALAAATTLAEIIKVTKQARSVYAAAKHAARLAKANDTDSTALTACHRIMADALILDASAQCRLADAYDAAQNFNPALKQGGDRRSQAFRRATWQ